LSNKVGIYQIRNTINGKVYVGSSIRMNHRKYEHFCDLNKGKHHSIKLQRAYNKYGKDSFIFEVIECIQLTEDLGINSKLITAREQFYIDSKNSYTLGYNSRPLAETNLGCKRSEDVKRKMSISFRGSLNPNFGKTMPDNIKKRISDAKMGRKNPHTSEQDRRIGESNPNKRKVINLTTLEVYVSVSKASSETGVDRVSLYRCCQGKYGSAGDFIWAYYNESISYSKILPSPVSTRPKKVINLTKGIIYESLNQASLDVGSSCSCIRRCCKGKRKTSGGFEWAYYTEKV